ncbi:epithelial chloride channel -like protein [Labeo rohita]|uniref:Epithelial chloride channel-like protein n=1 Tax=Labeo rohita TaxID=84645 RepID=A0A498LJU0_LABRO|nr:epithelial chloride channel -like protein [Labeo rohita]
MASRMVFLLLWMLLPFTSTGIKLDGNGYVDIIIAIGSKVSQDNRLIDAIKDIVTNGSLYLYEALDKKVYFKEATILVPSHWTSKDFSKARTESFEKAKIRIDHANPAYGVEPYTNQYEECGAEGEYIHFTPEYLLNDTVIQLYGSRGKVFVHEWAHMRWGVYDETSDKKTFYHSNGQIEATRCSKNIKGVVQLNPPKPPVSVEPLEVGSFTRTATGESFEVKLPGTAPPNFPPNRITDLSAEIQEDTVLLSWTAPGEDLDQGTGKVFVHEWAHLRWGVFDETIDKKPFYIFNRHCEATRCSKNIKGELHEITAGGSLQRCSMDPQTSLPTEKCKFFPNKNQNTNSSLMFLPSLDSGPRILQQQQAATHFLRNIIEDQARVGIVTFSSSAATLSPLTTIDSDTTRENLIKLLPKVLQKDGDVSGDELIFLTDGMATDNIAGCAPSAIQSGAIIHTVAFGNSADPALTEIANKTGEVQLNPPKPTVSDEPLGVGSFTRTATGESFVVTLSGPPPNFPPNRITDLSAKIQDDSVLLSWTAPGEDLDEGTAKSYEIRWSFDSSMLRDSFSNGHAVNTAAVSPQEAGLDMATNWSLFEALDKKICFKEATILIPSHWTSKDFSKARTESFEKVLQDDNGDVLGDELIFLTDGQATDDIDGCAPSAIRSGAIVHKLAFSNNAANALNVMAESTARECWSKNI